MVAVVRARGELVDEQIADLVRNISTASRPSRVNWSAMAQANFCARASMSGETSEGITLQARIWFSW